MIAILSATEHDFYAMPLPFVVYSWAKIGVSCIVFIPAGNNPKLDIARKYCQGHAYFYEFECEEKRIPTFSQVSRLFGAAIPDLPENEVLITGDSDMCVFSEYFEKANDGQIHIFGSDLTPEDQWPMCYCAMPVYKWKRIFNITRSSQEHVASLVNPIQGVNIRGENWCFDQWYLKKKLSEHWIEGICLHKRGNNGTQFASNRADRDGWHFDPSTIIDAHLPRPLTDIINFQKVLDLFCIKYPDADLSWMQLYYNEYISLL